MVFSQSQALKAEEDVCRSLPRAEVTQHNARDGKVLLHK